MYTKTRKFVKDSVKKFRQIACQLPREFLKSINRKKNLHFISCAYLMHEYNYDVNINAYLGIDFFQKKNVNNYLGSTSAVCYFMNILIIIFFSEFIVIVQFMFRFFLSYIFRSNICSNLKI